VDGELIRAGDTRLHVVRRGDGPLPLIVLHGGPGLDHTEFGHWLDTLGDACTLLLVDQRSQGRSDPAPPETWTIGHLAADVGALAEGLGLERYAVLGHSFGAFVALRHAVEAPRGPVATVVSAGVPAACYLEAVDEALARFEPAELRGQVIDSWRREGLARSPIDVDRIMVDQLPFHFADPHDPRIGDLLAAMREGRYTPEVLAASADAPAGELDLEDRLGEVAHPMLVLAGRHDRVCTLTAAEAIAAGVPGAELRVLEHSAHMGFVEEPDAYRDAVRGFLARAAAPTAA
jgi:proline iminopeptidase